LIDDDKFYFLNTVRLLNWDFATNWVINCLIWNIYLWLLKFN
jgi:hypothetical protein